MEERESRDFLIRNLPVELFNLLEQSAKENHRSKTQEAIVILTEGLTIRSRKLQKPKPFKWDTKITESFIEKAIDEGRE
jgi:hypothetical protein